MRSRIFVLCALCVGFAAMARAQAPGQVNGSFSLTCNPAPYLYDFGSAQQLSMASCTTTATANGLAYSGLTRSTYLQVVKADQGVLHNEAWGFMVGTLTNGDQVYIETYGVSEQIGANSNATMSYKIVGGTGTANGFSGSGTCRGAGGLGRGSQWTCTPAGSGMPGD